MSVYDREQIKVYLICTGVGIMNRGIETFARECFDGLHGTEGLDIKLFKGAGAESTDEYRVWNLARNSDLASVLGKCIRRNGYVVEQLSSFPSLVHHIRRGKPDLIFYSDSNLGFQLYRWRQQIGVNYRMLFSNGGPCGPPFTRTDHVQQVTPFHREMALKAGEPAAKHSLVPYGIHVPAGKPSIEPQEREQMRERLGIPVKRPVVLSVGWISARHKRMDYVVNEVAALPEPRPYLVLLGHMDENSTAIVDLANRKLGKEGFTARSIPYEQVVNYYQSADVFVLGSLEEGFGRVYLEALIHGLPCVVHDHPVMHYVLGAYGTFTNLSKPNSLAKAIADILQQPRLAEAALGRREYVRQNFSWESLAPAYLQMFRNCLVQGKARAFSILS